MAQVTAFTAARSKQIEDTTVVTGSISGDDLILYQRDGTVINAGNVRGPQGIQGPVGDGTTNINSVTTDMIQDNQITQAKMATNSVDSDQYVDGSIDKIHLASDVIDSTKIEDNALRTEHYNDLSIQGVHLANGTITGTKIANDTVGQANMVPGSITSQELATNSVSTSKIQGNAVTEAEVYTTGWIALALQSKWENYPGRQPAQYRKVLDQVEFRGTVRLKSGQTLSASGDYIGYAGVGYRIDLQDEFPSTSVGPEAGLYFGVETAGAIRLYGYDSAASPIAGIGLSGIRYSYA